LIHNITLEGICNIVKLAPDRALHFMDEMMLEDHETFAHHPEVIFTEKVYFLNLFREARDKVTGFIDDIRELDPRTHSMAHLENHFF